MTTKKSLILQLTILSSQMVKAADAMREIYPASIHVAELKEAAKLVSEWANDINEEILEEKN